MDYPRKREHHQSCDMGSMLAIVPCRFASLVIIYAIVFSAFSAVPSGAEDLTDGPARHLQSVTLKLKWKHQFQFAGYYAALEKGFYRDAGLDVSILEIAGEEETVYEVLDGNADFGVGMSDLVVHRVSGKPVVALAAIFQHSPLILLAAESSGIDNIHLLQQEGVRIGMEAHSAELIAYMQDEGLSLDEIEMLHHDFTISNLITGKVDAISAYSTDEPYNLLTQGIKYTTFTPRSAGIDFYGDTLFTSEKQIEDHPERVAAFLSASLKGWEYALDNPEEIVELIWMNYTQRHSREHLLFEADHSQNLIRADVVELGYMHLGRWKHIAETYAKLGMIDEDFSLEGFLYSPNNQEIDYAWLKKILWLLTGSCLLLGGGALTLAIFNRTLKAEIAERKRVEAALALEKDNLQGALNEIKTLEGLLPICATCKKIRDDRGDWNQIEEYVGKRSGAEFSHSICPECAEKHYPDLDLYGK